MEGLQTAMALIGNERVQLAYILPLIITSHLGEEGVILPEKDGPWEYEVRGGPERNYDSIQYGFRNFISEIDRVAAMSDAEISRLTDQGVNAPAQLVMRYGYRNGSDSYRFLQNYRELARVIARFS